MQLKGLFLAITAPVLLAIACVCPSAQASEVEARAQCGSDGHCVSMNPAQVLQLAASRQDAGDVTTASVLFEALVRNRDADISTEAQFRLGLLFQSQGRFGEAAEQFRKLLVARPKATRIRLELARSLAAMGKSSAAQSELRRASAGGLPDEVARVVQGFALALRSARSTGASLQISFAPDTNANSATKGNAAIPGIGPVTLSDDATAKPSFGLTLAGEVFWRRRLGAKINTLVKAQATGNFYTDKRFNDASLTLAAGPEVLFTRTALRPSVVASRRWYGGQPYARSLGLSIDGQRSLNRTNQLQFNLSALHTDVRRNQAMNGWLYSAVLRFDSALTPTATIRIATGLARGTATDRAFSYVAPTGSLIVSKDLHAMTVFGRVDYTATIGDAPFAFVGRRRNDRLTIAEAGITCNTIRFHGFSPYLRFVHSQNRSPVFFYNFKRTRLEFTLAKDL